MVTTQVQSYFPAYPKATSAAADPTKYTVKSKYTSHSMMLQPIRKRMSAVH